jgi:hypothetical protein
MLLEKEPKTTIPQSLAGRWFRKKFQMQSAQKLRSAAPQMDFLRK